MDAFVFGDYHLLEDLTGVDFSYRIDRGSESLPFVERISFPSTLKNPALQTDSSFHEPLHGVHIALGISYWKTYCPKEIIFSTYSISPDQAHFWDNVYTKGLGEFFYRNQIDFRNLIHFPSDSSQIVVPKKLTQNTEYLLGVGGGKDSLVSAELLKKNNIPFKGFVVETQKPYPLIDEVLNTMGVSAIRIKRTIDPRLFHINSREDSFNGHIPISLIYAFLGSLSSVWLGYNGLIVSNERSANEGNREYLGVQINHQWSKSFEFESMMQGYIESIWSSGLIYFSLIRPLSEYLVAKFFSQYHQYFEVFSSCNRNFSITQLAEKRWCGNCPKCAFVFLLLAVHLKRDEVIRIIGSNLLDRADLIPLYQKLMGLTGAKPFECVGTYDEVNFALYQIDKDGQFSDSPVIQMAKDSLWNGIDVKAVSQSIMHIDKTVLPLPFQSITYESK